MMKKGLCLSILVFTIFLIGFVSADVSCDKTLITKTYTYGQSASDILTCFNNGSSTVSLSSSNPSLFTVNQSSIPINLSTQINVSFSLIASVGLHNGNVNVGGILIPVSFLVEETEVVQGDILVFPTSKVISVTQGSSKTQNIKITVPLSYPRIITGLSFDLNPVVETIYFGDYETGALSPGEFLNIPIVFSGVGASVGTYQTLLTIQAMDSEGEVAVSPVNLQLIVTSTISPQTNYSLDNLPQCSVSLSSIGVNQTSVLTCSRPDPNLEIHPVIDPNYLIGVRSEETSSQYIYTFKGKSVGVSNIQAKFFYNNAQIGEAFNQSIKVTHGNYVGGVDLDLIFYQGGKSKEKDSLGAEETIIHVVDDSSRNILESAKLYIGGVERVNKTLILETNEVYEITATYSGYNPLYLNLTASRISIPFSISPSKTLYAVGETISITSEIENVSYLIDNFLMENPYTFSSSGNFTITAIKEGYSDTNLNVSVGNAIQILLGETSTDLKKGETYVFDLNEDSSWVVRFTESSEDAEGNEVYTSAPLIIASGTGKRVSFETENVGMYEIEAEGVVVAIKYVKKSFWNKPLWFWGVSFVGLIVVCVVIKKGILNNLKKSSLTSDVPVGYGTDYGIGEEGV